ncbi:AbrB/MazE/SpoVT family DNA-binding domain-containing protein [Chloroflexi bacterium TSY]|nr:AbrB/MazE/SpoVT family DNA-binding domain-containing protein [Chloroflexi bacterium TSY]
MAVEKITTMGDSIVLTLPKSVLEQLNVQIGDRIDISIVDNLLIGRPADNIEEDEKVDEIVQDLVNRRRRVYEALAAGTQ